CGAGIPRLILAGRERDPDGVPGCAAGRRRRRRGGRMVHVSGGVGAPVPELRLDGVAVRHGRHRVVEALTWVHRAGRIAWLIGENGAGKSSLLRVMAGRARPAAGTVELRDPSGRSGERIYYRPAMRLPG